MLIFDAHKYSYLNPVALDWLLLPCMFQYCLHHCGWSSKVYCRDRVLFLGVCICTAIVKDDPNNRDDCIPTSILHSKERTERQYISMVADSIAKWTLPVPEAVNAAVWFDPQLIFLVKMPAEWSALLNRPNPLPPSIVTGRGSLNCCSFGK